jgi:hypothetical protein
LAIVSILPTKAEPLDHRRHAARPHYARLRLIDPMEILAAVARGKPEEGCARCRIGRQNPANVVGTIIRQHGRPIKTGPALGRPEPQI